LAPTLAVGVDLVEIARVAEVLGRHPQRFLTRHFTPDEVTQCGSDPRRLASRWAAKEAVSKALGTGIGPVRWTDMEVLSDSRGAPHLALHGSARRIAEGLGLQVWTVSLSDTRDHAVAVVVAVGARPTA
jgi:holo-[acyl-carrier protein] synthase